MDHYFVCSYVSDGMPPDKKLLKGMMSFTLGLFLYYLDLHINHQCSNQNAILFRNGRREDAKKELDLNDLVEVS